MDVHDQRIIHASGQSGWRTDPQLFEALRPIFPFQVDLAASPETALCEAWLGPGSPLQQGEDALQVSWAQLMPWECGFLNPPYSKKEIRELKAAGVQNGDPRLEALRIQRWAERAYMESIRGFSTVGIFPYAPQTGWFRNYVMGHSNQGGWRGHAALDYWRIPHRVSFLRPDGTPAQNAGVNHCIIHWGPNPGFVGPWVPSGRYWSYR